jgi:hypothetical protein
VDNMSSQEPGVSRRRCPTLGGPTMAAKESRSQNEVTTGNSSATIRCLTVMVGTGNHKEGSWLRK